MSEIIERVAKALRSEFERQGGYGVPNGYIDLKAVDDAALARAAIEAMSEPTVQMVSAGEAAFIKKQKLWGREAYSPKLTEIKIAFEAMIDAALGKKE